MCLYDHNSGVEVGCTLSDTTGEFSLAVLVGLDVEVRPKYNNHTFSRTHGSSPSGEDVGADGLAEYFTISAGSPWTGIGYSDMTTQALTVEVVGGLCERVLGESIIHLLLPDCAGQDPTAPGEPFTREFTISAAKSATFQVPAVASYVKLQEVTNFDIVANYFDKLDTRTQQADLSQSAVTIRYEYHPELSFSVAFSGARSSGCASQPVILDKYQETEVTISVLEVFSDAPSPIADCDWVEGNITVVNLLGEAVGDDSLTICRSGCSLSIENEVLNQLTGLQGNAYVKLNISTGAPETNPGLLSDAFPYTKAFLIQALPAGWSVQQLLVPVVITGNKAISDFFSVPYPEWEPLTVVRDPPGGLSYTEYKNVKVTIDITQRISHSEANPNPLSLTALIKNPLKTLKDTIDPDTYSKNYEYEVCQMHRRRRL